MKSPARRTSLHDDESTGHRKKAVCVNERGILTNSSHIRSLRQFFSIKTLTNTVIVPTRVAYDQKNFPKKARSQVTSRAPKIHTMRLLQGAFDCIFALYKLFLPLFKILSFFEN